MSILNLDPFVLWLNPRVAAIPELIGIFAGYLCRLPRLPLSLKWRSKIHASCFQVPCTHPGLFSLRSKRYTHFFSNLWLALLHTIGEWSCIHACNYAVKMAEWGAQQNMALCEWGMHLIPCILKPPPEFFLFYFFCKHPLLEHLLLWSSVGAGSIRTHQSLRWACSWTI